MLQIQGASYEDYGNYETYEDSPDNIYDNEFIGAHPLPSVTKTSYPPVSTTIQQQPRKKRSFPKWKITTIIFGVTAAALVGVVIYLAAVRTSNSSQVKSTSAVFNSSISSCLDLKKQSMAKSGIKAVNMTGTDEEIEVYCDMETDGGGWTLVASIHETDIETKCASDDRWSVFIPPGEKSAVKTNWENEDVFGTVGSCLQDDYKNMAYYNSNASDVMIWHVPRLKQVGSMRAEAFLRYRSTNQFLQKYGGNLKTVFNEYFPLSNTNGFNSSETPLQTLSDRLSGIQNIISGWYTYQMTRGMNHMVDSNMYSSFGNQVSLLSNRTDMPAINYGESFRLSCQSELFSSAVVPSTVLVMVKNNDLLTPYYSFNVYSQRTSAPVAFTEFSGERTLGDYELRYQAIQFYDNGLKTECRFHFIVSNIKEWNSKLPAKFHRNYQNFTGNVRQTIYVIEGTPARLLYGYTLLARERTQNYSTEDTDAIGDFILREIQTLSKDLLSGRRKTLLVPITFDQGSESTLRTKIPPSVTSSVQFGSVQFRAFNSMGYPNAICPGVSVAANSSEYVCIGGVSSNNSALGTCGDFAGWGGMPRDAKSGTRAVGHAHSFEDILSNILIFYR